MGALLGRRLWAFLIDELVLGAVAAFPLYLLLTPRSDGTGALALAIGAASQALALIYWVSTDYLFGQSLGKMVVRVKTVAASSGRGGGKVGFFQALLRSLTKLVNFLLLLDSLRLLWGGGEQRSTDALAGTTVVEWI